MFWIFSVVQRLKRDLGCSFFKFLDYTIIRTHIHTYIHTYIHTHTHTHTQGRNPLNEWSACYTGGCLHVHPPSGIRTHYLSNRSVGIATRCEMQGPGIESPWGRDIPDSSTLALGPTQALIQWLPLHVLNNPTPFRAKVKEREEQFLYPILGFRGLF